MVSRSSEVNEGPPPSSRTPGTPAKARVAKLGSSPSKRDEKSGEGRVVKSSAKDVAELKDYVRIWPCYMYAILELLTLAR
jgi:hypothetical protein